MSGRDLAIGGWAAIWVVVVAVLAWRSRRGDRRAAAGWMILVSCVLAAVEYPGLLSWLASTPPAVDPDGLAGVAHADVIGRLYVGAAFAVAALALSVAVARTELRSGRPWAWWALLAVLVVAGGADVASLALVDPHGLPLGLGAHPASGDRGWGWPPLVAWIVIWAFALWWARSDAGSSHPAARSST